MDSHLCFHSLLDWVEVLELLEAEALEVQVVVSLVVQRWEIVELKMGLGWHEWAHH